MAAPNENIASTNLGIPLGSQEGRTLIPETNNNYLVNMDDAIVEYGRKAVLKNWAPTGPYHPRK